MEDAEKLTALKKAYADIILNTAKEAAVRVMSSERRSLRFQQELCAAKDESLRMLVRIKQMMDSKVNEAEATSLSQKKKIDELEAQLHEAEDIVRDLREELSDAQTELEKMREIKLQHLDKHDLKRDPGTPKKQSQGSKLDNLVSIMFPSNSQDESKSTANQRYGGNECNTNMSSHIEVCSIGKPDFTSVIMGNKNSALYRNGCTQRIHAFDGNLLDENIHHHIHEDNGKNKTVSREDEVNVQTSLTPNSEIGNITPDGINNVLQEAVTSVRRKRKRSSRYTKLNIPLSRCISKKPDATLEKSTVSCSETCTNLLPSKVENPSNANGNDTLKDRESPSEVDGRLADNLNETTKTKSVLDDSVLSEEESGSVKSSLADLTLEACDNVNMISNQPRDYRFLKYTFARKRKKVSLNKLDGKTSLDEDTSKRGPGGESENEYLEASNSSSKVESIRDSRRLAQVARQLISLSEKRW